MVGRTETVCNNLSPNFAKVFDVNYYFEKNQIIYVEVFDYDEEDADDLIGKFTTPLNKILTNASQQIKGDLAYPQNNYNNKARGKIILKADSVAKSNTEVSLNVSAYVHTMVKKGIWCFCKGY